MAMGKAMAVIAAVVMVATMMAATTPRGVEGAVTCGMVAQQLGACRAYLTGPGGAPPAACCAGVRALNGMARAVPDRQQACNCLKSLYTVVRPNAATAKALPSQCGVNLGGIPIDPSVDCSKIH